MRSQNEGLYSHPLLGAQLADVAQDERRDARACAQRPLQYDPE